MPKGEPWQPQLPGGGNNIPKSYLREWAAHWKMSIAVDGEDQQAPEDNDLARFLRDEL